MRHDAPAAVRARGIRVARGGKAIVRSVDVEAEPGEVLGVLGPSGAGKSTFFRALVGEIVPDAGSVSFSGVDVTGWPLWKRARAGLGYIPQGPSVFWELTVRQNLDIFQQIMGCSSCDSEVRAARVGLSDRMAVLAGELSAGERRRLELARAVTRTPRVLVCDEPFAGVDPVGATHLASLLSDMAREGATIILADHHVAQALTVCTRAVLLLDGAIVACASAKEFPNLPIVRGRYLGTLEEPTPAGASRG